MEYLWHCCDAKCDHPADYHWENWETVKSNPLREVRTNGRFFAKFELKKGHGFAKEFRHAADLEAAGLPVVKHVAWGESPRGGALLTEALTDSVSAEDYWHVHGAAGDDDFTCAVAGLAEKMCQCGVLHRDCHLGNFLYQPEVGLLTLVDVRQVNVLPRWCRPEFLLCRVRQLPLELREFLPKARLIELLKSAGVKNPEIFYRQRLLAIAKRLNREWPRRIQQICRDYPKFVRREGDWQLRQPAYVPFGILPEKFTLADLQEAVELPLEKEQWLLSFRLNLAKIPVMPPVAWNSRTNTALFPAVYRNLPPVSQDSDDLPERLKLFNLPPAVCWRGEKPVWYFQ